MLGLEDLEEQSRQLDNKINDCLRQQEILHSKEIMTKSRIDHNRASHIRKLREKLNLVVCSRNKANESNKRLLADFDRVQKHLAMMESKTNVLLDKVTTHKAALDDHYPNWREKANMFVAPNYITQENIFNMLDSLRCRLNTNYDSSLPPPHTEVNFNSGESLAAMLDPQFVPTATKPGTSPRKSVKSTPRSTSPLKDPVLPVISERSAPSLQTETPPKLAVPSVDPTAETLTQITKSGDVSLKLADDDVETEDTISPRPLFSYQPAPPVATGFEESESSEGGVEDMLSPKKITAKPADTTRDRNPSADSRASVDTVIKNPIAAAVVRTTPTRLATLTSQISQGDTETESTAPIYTPSLAPGKRKTALDLLNESSESEAVQAAATKNKESEDSEDDFDFFD